MTGLYPAPISKADVEPAAEPAAETGGEPAADPAVDPRASEETLHAEPAGP